MCEMQKTLAQERDSESGYTRTEIPLTSGVWTQIVPHCNKRRSLHLAPSSPNFLISFGLNAPVTIPTLVNHDMNSAYTYTDKLMPAMVRGPVWAFTLSTGVTVIVNEEIYR